MSATIDVDLSWPFSLTAYQQGKQLLSGFQIGIYLCCISSRLFTEPDVTLFMQIPACAAAQ